MRSARSAKEGTHHHDDVALMLALLWVADELGFVPEYFFVCLFIQRN